MVPEDQLRVIFAILTSLPFSFILKKLPSETWRKYFSLIIASLLQYYVYRNEIALSFSMHLLIYTAIRIKGRNCGYMITVLSLVLLSAYHIYRQYTDYGGWTLDVSTILMGNVCKYSLFAFSFQDGGNTKQGSLTKDQNKQKLVQLPNIIDYLVYCQFLPTCIVTTPISYFHYDNYMKQKQQFKDIPQVPSLIKLGKDALIMMVCALIYAIGSIYFPPQKLFDWNFIQHSSWSIFLYTFVSAWGLQWRYFFAFKLCMLPIHISGLSYKPSEEEDQFMGILYIDIKTFLTSLSASVKIVNWNTPVQEWLRKSIYQRLKTSKQMAKFLTFLCSAFWHGFYGGYYIAFTAFFIQMYLANVAYKLSKNQNNFLVKLYKKYQPFSFYLIWIYVNTIFTQNAFYFITLSFTKCFSLMKSIYFMPQISPIILIILLSLVAGKPTKQRTKQIKKDE